MDDISNGINRLTSFLEYTNQLQERLKTDPERVLEEVDEQVCFMLYDLAPGVLSISAMANGISSFAKEQFVLGMLWQRFKNSENDAGLNDLLKGVKGL